MVGFAALWLPIVLSAVVVFVASAIIHMALGYHWNDWNKLSGEDEVMETLREQQVGRGSYSFPRPESKAEFRSESFNEKYARGPAGFMIVLPKGPPSMGKNLVQWFVFTLVAGFLVAYVTGRTLEAGTDYLQVFRVAGVVAFLTYAGAEPVSSIWMGRKWSTTIKNVFDGLVYALLTAGVFGWLWPS